MAGKGRPSQLVVVMGGVVCVGEGLTICDDRTTHASRSLPDSALYTQYAMSQ